jgi:hypothetical protein
MIRALKLNEINRIEKSILWWLFLQALVISLSLFFSTGCSGGGETSPNGPGGSAPKPLTVVSISPSNGTVGINVNTPVIVTFSSAVDPATVNSSSFQVQGVSGTYSVSGATVTFTPISALAENTTYNINLTTSIADVDGNALQQNVAVSFVTGAKPQASAGNDLDVNRNEMVMLSATTNISSPVYKWRQLHGETVGTLNGATPGFMSPDTVGTLVFELIVNDGSADSSPDTIFVFVLEDKANSFWVHPAGNDANSGSRTSPFKTINQAIGVADDTEGDVYVAGGEYNESVLLSTGVSIYGGFQPENWLRDIFAKPTTINGGAIAVMGIDDNNLTLDGLIIRAADATVAGESSIAISLTRSQGIVITRNNIYAGNGSNGNNGAQPVRPTGANDGSNGTAAGDCIPANQGGNGGSGSGRAGGKGGSGGAAGGFDGNGGEGPCGNGGGGGFANSGSVGADGCTGAVGGDATLPGPGFGYIDVGLYLTGDGSFGNKGASGGGGGGGGGGAGSVVGCGGGGGGGGAGGIGGLGGAPGQGGGGSFGIILAQNSGATIVACYIATLYGGDGGYGSLGGPGGLGGDYGNGGGSALAGWAGGRGGNGGTGGAGGVGSGGGGGPSVGIVEVGSTSVQDRLTFSLGNFGLGGIRPDGKGIRGMDGERAEVKKIQ